MSEDKPKVEDGKFHIRCERVEAGKPNLNGRVYSAEVMQRMVDQIQKKLSYGVFFGRLGASNNPKVKMDDAAFRVMGAQIEQDGRIGADCEILNTKKGVVLEKMLEAQGASAFEIVPCGVGSTSRGEGGVTVIGADYRIASFDIEPRLEQPKLPDEEPE